MEKRYVAYLRVSTTKQGIDGLGMDAQRAAIRAYNGAVSNREFIEVESGKRSDRPALKEALALCKLTGATLLVAKLDRLSRNVAFISSLMDSGVDFIACDFPEANRLTLHILAAVAEHEAAMISTRTKAGLAQAKLRGKKLGNPNLTNESREQGNRKKGELADAFADRLISTIQSMRKDGKGLREIARELEGIGVKTARGGHTWTAQAVKNIMARKG